MYIILCNGDIFQFKKLQFVKTIDLLENWKRIIQLHFVYILFKEYIQCHFELYKKRKKYGEREKRLNPNLSACENCTRNLAKFLIIIINQVNPNPA